MAMAKRRNKSQKASQDSSAHESENTEEEEARIRAATFLMSAAEKRSYELRKKEEKMFNDRFKRIFAMIVANYMACDHPSNKVIDVIRAPKQLA